MKTLQRKNVTASGVKLITIKEGSIMKKTIPVILSIMMILCSSVLVSQAQAIESVVNMQQSPTIVQQPQTIWQWWANYLNNTNPDFRVKSVRVYYGYAGDPLNKDKEIGATVYAGIENIGGNKGITSGSFLHYLVSVGSEKVPNRHSIGAISYVPYWGQLVGFIHKTYVYTWDLNRPNVDTVQINIHESKYVPPYLYELNYENNTSTWRVITSDGYLSGWYDLVQVK